MNPEPQPFTLSDVRVAACQIRNAGLEHIAPELSVINGARVVSYVRDNKAFITIRRVANKHSPKRVVMNDMKPDLAIEYQKLAKAQVSVMVGSEQESGETQAQWARRMGLLPPWLGYTEDRQVVPQEHVNMQRHTVHRNAPKPKPEGAVLKSVPYYKARRMGIIPNSLDMNEPHHYIPQEEVNQEETSTMREYGHHELTEREIDVEFMSVPEMKEFRHNDPEGYARWVEELKEELGVHWDEGLVLQPFNPKGRKTKDMSWKEIDEDLDDMYSNQPETMEGAFIRCLEAIHDNEGSAE